MLDLSLTLAIFFFPFKINLAHYIQKKNSEVLGYFPPNMFLNTVKIRITHTLSFLRQKDLVNYTISYQRPETALHLRLEYYGGCVFTFFSVQATCTYWKKQFRLKCVLETSIRTSIYLPLCLTRFGSREGGKTIITKVDSKYL